MSQSKSLQWFRPLDVVSYPNVWMEFDAKESKNCDKLVKYRIQDLTEDRFDDAVQYLIEHFLGDEPLSKFYGGIKSKDYIDDCERIWRCAMQQKVSLVCFHEGSDEIVGLSLLIVNTKNDLFLKEFAEQCKSNITVEILKIFDICYESFTPYDKYGVDCYLGSLALSVNRKYRGIALGTRLLQTRTRLAAAFGFKITETLFTSDFSNAIADEAGFQSDVEFTFDELNKINPDFQFQNVSSKKVSVKTLIF